MKNRKYLFSLSVGNRLRELLADSQFNFDRFLKGISAGVSVGCISLIKAALYCFSITKNRFLAKVYIVDVTGILASFQYILKSKNFPFGEKCKTFFSQFKCAKRNDCLFAAKQK